MLRRSRPIPAVLWAPLAASTLMLAVGLLALAAHQPWLFPSLGPTAFLQAELPDHRTASLRNVIVGHTIGVAMGILAVLLVGANESPSVLAAADVPPVRVLATVIAVGLTMTLELLVDCSHAPSVATTLLFSLGALAPTLHSVLAVLVGVVVVGVLGEGLRRIRLRALHRGPSRPPGREATNRTGTDDRNSR
jgi:hypothetical protein